MNSNKIAILSLIVATCSFIYNPIVDYFKGPDISLRTGDFLWVSSNFGNLEFQHFVQASNLGTDKGNIKKMKLYIKRYDSKGIKIAYSARNFSYDKFYSDNTPILIPFEETILKPNENWTGFVNFYSDIKKDEEENLSIYKDLIIDELDSIAEEYRFNTISPKKQCASDEAFKPMQNYVEEKLKILETGEYFALLLIWDQIDTEPFFKKLYSFTVYPSDLKKLKQNTNELKKGMWINYFPDNRGFGFTSTLTELNDIDKINQLSEEYHRME